MALRSRFPTKKVSNVDVRRRTSTYVDVPRRTSPYVDVRQRTLTDVDVGPVPDVTDRVCEFAQFLRCNSTEHVHEGRTGGTGMGRLTRERIEELRQMAVLEHCDKHELATLAGVLRERVLRRDRAW